MEITLATPCHTDTIQHFDRHIPPDRLRECICNNQIYILSDNTQVIGYLRFSLFWQTNPFLDLIYLDSNWRGQGWGTSMMRFWEEAMALQGYRYVMLSTQEDETAKYFYEKLGYKMAGSFLPPEQPVPELIYWKEIKPE